MGQVVSPTSPTPPRINSLISRHGSLLNGPFPTHPPLAPCLTVARNMPGPIATGGGIGANAPKNKLTGVVMVRPFPPCSLRSPSHPFFPLLSRPLSPHSVASYLVMILVPSPVFSRCLTGFVPLVTPFPSRRSSPTATAFHHLKGPSWCPFSPLAHSSVRFITPLSSALISSILFRRPGCRSHR